MYNRVEFAELETLNESKGQSEASLRLHYVASVFVANLVIK